MFVRKSAGQSNIMIYGILSALILYVVFFPTYYFGDTSIAGQRILYLTYPVILLFIFFVHYTVIRRFYFPAFSMVLILSFAVYYITIHSKISFLDEKVLVTHLRYLAYFIIFTGVYNLARYYKVDADILKNLIYALFYIVAAFIVLQLVNGNAPLIKWISIRDPFGYLGLQIGGPFVWTYSLGLFLSLALFLFIGSWFVYGFKLRYFLTIVPAFLLIIFSQSKSTYMAFFAISVLFSFIYILKAPLVRKIYFISMFVVFFAVAAYFLHSHIHELGNIARFLDALEEGRVDPSTGHRLYELSYTKYTTENNPVFGYPVKDIIIENAYGYYYYTYGILGFTLYLSVLLYINLKNYKILRLSFKNERYMQTRPLAIGFIAYSVSVFFISLSGSPLDGHKTSYLFWTLLGTYYGMVKNSDYLYDNKRNKQVGTSFRDRTDLKRGKGIIGRS